MLQVDILDKTKTTNWTYRERCEVRAVESPRNAFSWLPCSFRTNAAFLAGSSTSKNCLYISVRLLEGNPPICWRKRWFPSARPSRDFTQLHGNHLHATAQAWDRKEHSNAHAVFEQLRIWSQWINNRARKKEGGFSLHHPYWYTILISCPLCIAQRQKCPKKGTLKEREIAHGRAAGGRRPYVWHCICLLAHLSFYLTIYLSIYLPWSVYLSPHSLLSPCLSSYLSTDLSACLSVYLQWASVAQPRETTQQQHGMDVENHPRRNLHLAASRLRNKTDFEQGIRDVWQGAIVVRTSHCSLLSKTQRREHGFEQCPPLINQQPPLPPLFDCNFVLEPPESNLFLVMILYRVVQFSTELGIGRIGIGLVLL